MRIFLMVLIIYGLATMVSVAQEQPTVLNDTCPQVVTEALSTLDQTCSAVARNSACYGNVFVSATFSEPVDESLFSQPSDRVELAKLSTIQTTPLNETAQQWGLALLHVQANVPNTLPGQGVLFLLMGDATLKNETHNPPQQHDLITVTTKTPANLRSLPNKRANIIGSVPANTELQGDVASPDGKWLRVIREGIPMWLHRQTITQPRRLKDLPRPDLTAMSHMQSFQFTGGVGYPQCQPAQGALLIQGPNDLEVDIQVNGARISISSSILIGQTANHELEVTVLSGAANVGGVTVPAGHYVVAKLGADNRVEGQFSPARQVSPEKRAALRLFSQVPPRLMYYTIDLPEVGESPAELRAGSNPGGDSIAPTTPDEKQQRAKKDKKDKQDKKDKKEKKDKQDKGKHPHHDHDDDD